MEEWKSVVGYEGLYEVSNLGRVKSLNYGKQGYEKILIPVNNNTYGRVGLLGNKKSIHRLVAIAFIQNPLNLPCVLHKKEDLDENGMLYNGKDNLYWGTHSENSQDRENKGRGNKINFPWKGKFGKYHNCSKGVNQYTKEGIFIKEWDSLIDVERNLGIIFTSLSKCCNGKRKTAGGFIWKFNKN